MRYYAAVAIIILAAGNLLGDDNPTDSLAKRREAYQNALERYAFDFRESDVGVFFSLSQYGGDCKIHMIYDPKEWSRLTFQFERDGKEILTLTGHEKSVFRTDKNILYFASYSRGATGCIVPAYDLTTGKELWETELNAAGKLVHFGYSNQVTMSVSTKGDEGAVTIIGRESFADYVEVLDSKSGEILAHKIYRQGFGPSKR